MYFYHDSFNVHCQDYYFFLDLWYSAKIVTKNEIFKPCNAFFSNILFLTIIFTSYKNLWDNFIHCNTNTNTRAFCNVYLAMITRFGNIITLH